jgi:two-component system aerobic respiration control sensor histidine kinase ArcB
MTSRIEKGTFSAKVLWVDDEPTITTLGKEVLERLGHCADIASDGEEALGMLNEKKYDLLITDLCMPRMSGCQLAEKIKGNFHGMRVAIATGLDMDLSDEEKEKYGVGHVLKKPISLADVKRLLEKTFQEKI